MVPCKPSGGHHEAVSPAELEEDPQIHYTSSTTLPPLEEQLASPGELSTIPGDLEVNEYGQATPLLARFSGQGPGGYQGTPAGGVFGTPTLGRTMGSPTLYSRPSLHTLDVYRDPPARTPTYDGTESDCTIRGHVASSVPVLRANITAPDYGGSGIFGYIYPADGNPAADRFHIGGQLLSATPDDGSYGGGAPIFSNPGGTYCSDPAAMEPRLEFNNAQATLMISCVADDSGYRDLSGSRPDGGVGNEGPTQLPAGSPPDADNVGSQRPQKRKRATNPENKHKTKRARPRMSQHLDTGEAIQPTLPTIPPSRSNIHVVEQDPYQCKSQQKGWDPLPSIDFKDQGREGMNLTDAMNLRFDGPDGRDDLMFEHGNIGNSVSCRMAFLGFPVCKSKQIVTTNHKKERGRITREKLAQVVAKRVKTYLEELEEGGTPFPIRFEDMVLVRLNHVARASWQPELWYQVRPSTNP